MSNTENKIITSIKKWMKKSFSNLPEKGYDFALDSNTNPIVNEAQNNNSASELSLNNQSVNTPENDTKKIFTMIDLNLDYMKVRYNSMINSDIVIREFILTARNKQYKSFLVYIDGMINSDIMNNYILKPLMLKNTSNSFDGNQTRVVSEVVTNNITVRKVKKFDAVEYILNCLLPQNTVDKTSNFDDLISGINSGNCALFIDTLDVAFNIEVKGFEKRSLENPNNEVVVRGEQVGFTENLRTNTSLLRRYINNENLIIESLNVGTLSKTKCAVCYLKNVANSDLISEVKYRINNLKIDYLISSRSIRTVNTR